MRITIELAEDIALHPDPGREALEAVAIEGYRSGALSGYQARTLLGLTRFEFDGFLKDRNVWEHSYSQEIWNAIVRHSHCSIRKPDPENLPGDRRRRRFSHPLSGAHPTDRPALVPYMIERELRHGLRITKEGRRSLLPFKSGVCREAHCKLRSQRHGDTFQFRLANEAESGRRRKRSDADGYVQQLVEHYLDHDVWFRQKVKKGLEQLDRGEYLTHEEVGERIERMFRS